MMPPVKNEGVIMNKYLYLLVLVALLPLSFAQNTMNLFTWPEYIDPEIISQFEEAFDVKVTVDLFDSNEEALGKLQAGSLGLYDVAIITSYAIPVFASQGMLQVLDHSRIPNISNLDAKFLDPSFDPGNTYSIAYQWGTTGLAYRADLVDEAPTSWAVIFDPESEASFTLIDDMRPMIGHALLYLGYDYNSQDADELVEARDLLIEAKERSLGFYGSVKSAEFLLTGEAQYAIVYTGDALQAADENENIKYVIPQEGAEIWVDSMTLLKDAPNPDMAYAFINYILEPEIGGQLTNWVFYPSPNAAAYDYIDEEIRSNPVIFLSAEEQARLDYTLDVENLELYDLIWTQIKSR
jgi:spermidine/putrescine transport system substrate-binding protein